METITKLSRWVGIPLFLSYLIAMVIVPFFSGDWHYLQTVWERWQGLNVGVLAFMTSLVALNISNYNAEKQRRRNFRAAQASLPSALDDLCSYTDEMALYYKDALKAVSNRTVFVFQPPDLITSFEPVFSECIKHANPRVGDGLAKILSRLQVQRARCIDLVNDINDSGNLGSDVSTQVNRHLAENIVLTEMYSLIKLRALINRMFPFARAQQEFDDARLKPTELMTACRTLDFDPERIDYCLSEDD
jgi:hypothetical protein